MSLSVSLSLLYFCSCYFHGFDFVSCQEMVAVKSNSKVTAILCRVRRSTSVNSVCQSAVIFAVSFASSGNVGLSSWCLS